MYMKYRNCRNCNDKSWLIECACGCGGIISRYSKHTQLQKYIKNHGNGLANYKGGRHPDKDGYMLILKKGHHRSNTEGYVREHILVYEDHYKCCIIPGAVIHHINKIRDDNRIENLELMFNSSHTYHHHHKGKIVSQETREKSMIDMSNRFCMVCKTKTVSLNTKNKRPAWYKNTKGDGFLCRGCRDHIYYGWNRQWKNTRKQS